MGLGALVLEQWEYEYRGSFLLGLYQCSNVNYHYIYTLCTVWYRFGICAVRGRGHGSFQHLTYITFCVVWYYNQGKQRH